MVELNAMPLQEKIMTNGAGKSGGDSALFLKPLRRHVGLTNNFILYSCYKSPLLRCPSSIKASHLAYNSLHFGTE